MNQLTRAGVMPKDQCGHTAWSQEVIRGISNVSAPGWDMFSCSVPRQDWSPLGV